ncbi:MAG: glycosyltransferase family 1 protein [Alphaproteobacteria bacterium]|nr:glycosyltransferase family 1 protein [Alphaproteobacteria bacterium]
MIATPLRIALFSGNYNYVRDGANQALNRLVGYLLRQGVQVRIYSPTTDTPDFPPTGDLVSVASLPLPFGRGEYRLARGLTAAARADLALFAPDIVHVSAPDLLGHGALKWAQKRGIPVLASMHTRFETYPRYYGLGFLEPAVEAMLRRFYRRCDAVVAPSPSMADVMRAQGMSDNIGIWARGIDTSIFNPDQRDLAWRRGLGIADAEPVIGFLGRLVMEKGLDVFADSIDALRARGVAHRVLVIGEGPARDWFADRLKDGVFVGFQSGANLGRAVASMDMLFNPSITETFGNVTLETMACGIPVIAARATGSESLVADGVTGRLVTPGDVAGYAEALAAYCSDASLRQNHGAAGAQASSAYDWDAVNQAVLDQYHRLSPARSPAHG